MAGPEKERRGGWRVTYRAFLLSYRGLLGYRLPARFAVRLCPTGMALDAVAAGERANALIAPAAAQ